MRSKPLTAHDPASALIGLEGGVVESDRGTLPLSLTVGLLSPIPERAVRLPPHPALDDPVPLSDLASPFPPIAKRSSLRGSGSLALFGSPGEPDHTCGSCPRCSMGGRPSRLHSRLQNLSNQCEDAREWGTTMLVTGYIDQYRTTRRGT